jgi:hypothetical protein
MIKRMMMLYKTKKNKIHWRTKQQTSNSWNIFKVKNSGAEAQTTYLKISYKV